MSLQKKEETGNNSPLGDGGGFFVIADDFTGAAELAGISLRYGLALPIFLHSDEVESSNNSPLGDGGGDGAIISTDSRSLNKTAAEKVTAAAVKNIVQLKPVFIYKKIDSVLRGYVIAELKIQMQLAGFDKALVIAANPSLGRTISNGEYFIDGKPVTETGFVNDPEFPISSSFVTRIVGDDSIPVLKHTDILPEQGILIGEAVSTDDIKAWAELVDPTWMFVGAGDFYTALLDKNYQQQAQQNIELQSPHLYVCGTAFSERKQLIKQLSQGSQNCVSYLPETVNESWLKKTSNILKEQSKAIIAIDESTQSALSLRKIMAHAVKEIVSRENIKEIFIEGGSTAAAIFEELKINKFIPVNELQRGVVRMKANDLLITVKPGSYKLPEEILKLYFIK